MCDQLAQCRYLAVKRPEVELATGTSSIASQHLNHSATRPSYRAIEQGNRRHHTLRLIWCCSLVSHFEYTPFLRRLFLCKHDVIHKAGSTSRIATPPEENRSIVSCIDWLSVCLSVCHMLLVQQRCTYSNGYYTPSANFFTYFWWSGRQSLRPRPPTLAISTIQRIVVNRSKWRNCRHCYQQVVTPTDHRQRWSIIMTKRRQ